MTKTTGLDPGCAETSPGDEREAALTRLAHDLRHVWHAVTAGVGHSERLADLQRQHFWILSLLAHGSRRMSELAADMGTSGANVTGLVDRLADRGLIERTRPDEDRRVVNVTLTELGREEMCSWSRRFTDALDELLAPLTEPERLELGRLLEKTMAGSARKDEER
jgi:DNA-binding MarR family transcriptional regulator